MTIEVNGKNYRRLKNLYLGNNVPIFELVDTIMHTKVVTKQIPLYTGLTLNKRAIQNGVFPAYLKDFRDCYEVSYDEYCLKEEWRTFETFKHRPSYTMEVTYPSYVVEVSDAVVEHAKEMEKRYEKLAKEWSRLIG